VGSQRVPARAILKSDRLLVDPLSVREFYGRRHHILVLRGTGGLGDILMHRMMFEDFKILIPEAEITFALPQNYWPAVSDHPYVDHIADSNTVDFTRFLAAYNTTTACGRHEQKVAPFADKHRSDIWADHCGLKLTRHEMHIRLTAEEERFGRELVSDHSGGKKVVILSPISAMKSKNMDAQQMNGVAAELRNLGFAVLCTHNTVVPEMKEAKVWSSTDIRKWMSVINASDAVVSVDTATFHCAGGLKKPLVGMFTWSDGLAYGKWFDFVLVQKHRSFTPGWECGPCYKWHDCRMCPSTKVRKPCVTELSIDDIMTGVSQMLRLWPQLRPLGWPFSQAHNQGRLAFDPDDRRVACGGCSSAAVVVVKAENSRADCLARMELPTLQAN